MMKGKPAIAVRRREEALQKFSDKLEKLQEALDAGNLEALPERMRPSTFVAWEDEELGVKKFSRSLLYETAEEYIKLHRKMESLLGDLAKARSKGTKKEDKSGKLIAKLEAAERRAQVYLNEYSTAMAELQDKLAEIARLEQQLARAREKNKKIIPFRALKTLDETDQ